MKTEKKSFIGRTNDHPVIFILIMAIILEITLESLCRRSVTDVFKYHTSEIFAVISNILIITFTLSLSFIFRRRLFAIVIITAFWLTCGITNCVLLHFRSAPLNISDFYVVRSINELFTLYITPFQSVLIAGAFLAAFVIAFTIWKRIPKQPTELIKILPIAFFSMVCIAVMSSQNVNAIYTPAESSVNVSDSLYNTYSSNGFVYSLSMSIFNRGIERPSDYGKKTVENILDSIDDGEKEETIPEKKDPDIILVQLESFFDVNRIDGVEYSENPIPVWSELRKNYTSGYLTVPVIGAGTAKTEFEILTGMSVKFFELGESPYNTVLKNDKCESIASILSSRGYNSTVIHNNTASFYDRDEVFPNLGFDLFVSADEMGEIPRNQIGWAYDNVLTDRILSASETEKDFVFAITVQSHGKYPNELLPDYDYDIDYSYNFDKSLALSDSTDEFYNYDINKLYSGENEENEEYIKAKNQYRYYINELNETDKFIGELISEIENRGEDTVIIFYGDHLPAIDFEYFNMRENGGGEIDMTEYVIWDNIGLSRENNDLFSYQLTAYLFSLLNIKGDPISELHGAYINNNDIKTNSADMEEYQQKLHMLEYDILYGEEYSYDE